MSPNECLYVLSSMLIVLDRDRQAEIVKALLDDCLRRSWLQRILSCGETSKRAMELKSELDKIEQDIRFVSDLLFY